ncbi:MAG: NRDE family protein [Hahellaceae bacterium]|nr:NRDE family protein [Hahellaceae bacterium]
MCLIVFAYGVHPRYPLVLAANRDEFFSRPTLPLHEWEDGSGIIAGRDLQGGGTWLGLARSGRFAALTNVRRLPAPIFETTRGALVSRFLTCTLAPDEFVNQQMGDQQAYAGFNLLLGSAEGLFYLSNRDPHTTTAPRRLAAGVYGLSNHLLDTPWPKVVRTRTALTQHLHSKEFEPHQLWSILNNRERPADNELPDTGVGLQSERSLSTAFIRLPGYGTRCSTILSLDTQGEVRITERTFSAPERTDRETDPEHEAERHFSLPRFALGLPDAGEDRGSDI